MNENYKTTKVGEDYNNIIEKQFQKVDEVFDIKILTSTNCKFEKTSGSFLSLNVDDEKYERVTIYRAFPFSEPNQYLSVRKATPKAEEIGMIISLENWPEDIKEMILQQLELRYFSPKIKEIKDIKEEYGFAYWTVDTDRGQMNFTTSIWSPITRITQTRLLVSDLDSNRYEIEDFNVLSKKEKKLIDLFL